MTRENVDTISGLLFGLWIGAWGVFLMHIHTRDKYQDDAIKHGVAKFILETPTSRKAKFVWITNTTETNKQ